MTTAELTSEARPPGAPHNVAGNGESPWSDQAILSGAGLINGGIQRTRATASALMDAADALTLGTFDFMDEWNSFVAQVVSQFVPVVTSKPTQLARKTYATTTKALRQAISEA